VHRRVLSGGDTNALLWLPAPAALLLIGLAACFMLGGCAGGVDRAGEMSAGGSLPPCPATPNCVNSDAAGGVHAIEPLTYPAGVGAAQAWNALINTIAAMPRMTIISRDPTYLHVEARSAIFRFVDDLEFQLRPEQRQIAFRSAARLGISDLGVNRRRMELIRIDFERGLLPAEPASVR
jgi:uncharacterized protein (DUF1499 family)